MKLASTFSQNSADDFQIMCSFCSRLLEDTPKPSLLSELVEQRHLLLEPPFSTVAADEAKQLYEVLDVASFQGVDAFCKRAAQDYTYLFYMVGASRTSPYESVYRTEDRTLFGPTTLEVRQCYQAHAMQVPAEGSQPDDHVATELQFVEMLLAKLGERKGLYSLEEQRHILEDLAAFLSNHLLVFSPVYFANLQVRAQDSFYQGVGAIAQKMIKHLAAALAIQDVQPINETMLLSANKGI